MAVEESIGRRLKKGELEQMMQKKQLDPEKILPLVGKHFMQLAKNGGALDDKLTQLETIQERLNQSWTFWIVNIYKRGLEPALIDLYKMLDKIFWFLEQGGTSAIGSFLKGFIGQLKETIQFVYDLGVVLSYVFERYFGAGMNMEMLGQAAYWILIVGSLNSVLKIMRLIFGGAMVGSIFQSAKALALWSAGIQTASTAAGAGAATGGAASAGKMLIGRVFIAGIEAAVLFSITRALMEGWGGAGDKFMGKVGSWFYERTHDTDINTTGKYGDFSLMKWFTGSTWEGINRRASQLQPQFGYGGIMPTSSYSYQTQPPQQQNVKVEVVVKDSEFAKAIDVRFADGFGKVINTMLPASTSRTSPPSLITR